MNFKQRNTNRGNVNNAISTEGNVTQKVVKSVFTDDQLVDNLGCVARRFIEDRDDILPVINLVDVISANCGWNPLGVGREMTIHFGGKKEYQIKRLQ